MDHPPAWLTDEGRVSRAVLVRDIETCEELYLLVAHIDEDIQLLHRLHGERLSQGKVPIRVIQNHYHQLDVLEQKRQLAFYRIRDECRCD